MADALQGRKNLDDCGPPLVERFLKNLFARVERLEPRLRVIDLCLDVAHRRCRFDELLVERAPIFAERLDLQSELGLAVRRLALPGPYRVELLIMLPDRIVGGRRGRRSGRGQCRPRRNLGSRRLREGSHVGAKRQRQSQRRAEQQARIGWARPSENHAFHGNCRPQDGKKKQWLDHNRTPPWHERHKTLGPD